jgi:hypothetical protein
VAVNVIPDPPLPISLGAPSCNATGNQVTVNWASGGGNTTGYYLRINNTANDGPGCADNWWCSDPPDLSTGIISPTSYSYAVTPGVNHTWWLHSVNSCGRYSSSVYGAGFNCTAASVDLKVNGSDGPQLTPLTIGEPANLNLTWTTTNPAGINGDCTAMGNWSGIKSKMGGTEPIYNVPAGNYSYTITCNLTTGEVRTDTVYVNVTGTAVDLRANGQDSLTVNGPTADITMSWTTTNSINLLNCLGTGYPIVWDGSKSVTGGNQLVSAVPEGTYNFRITCNKNSPPASQVWDEVLVEVKPPNVTCYRCNRTAFDCNDSNVQTGSCTDAEYKYNDKVACESFCQPPPDVNGWIEVAP